MDAERKITGDAYLNTGTGGNNFLPHGAYYSISGSYSGPNGTPATWRGVLGFDSSRVVPVANKVQVRAWGALACVYLGLPAS